jgi:hypothetical protein
VLTVGFSAIATDDCWVARVLVGRFDTTSVAVRVVAGLALAHRNRRPWYSTWTTDESNIGTRGRRETNDRSCGRCPDVYTKHLLPLSDAGEDAEKPRHAQNGGTRISQNPSGLDLARALAGRGNAAPSTP